MTGTTVSGSRRLQVEEEMVEIHVDVLPALRSADDLDQRQM
ncbi:hypothetical protein ABE142_23930 [Paenibacillus alvei]|nr:hypothetical protein [Paenibacillus alvei]EJW15770.1 hypothetical protein PAV_7c01450 [Paenibacillus alvei DSM 29]MEC0080704.1 hypothetical protein [Paenibacillus alvei]